jgi:copper chaperone NosL
VARRWLVGTWLTSLLVFLAAAMVDFYRWGYDYGHNLDPHAAIKLEGMTYQPPLIGYKQLLNFEAYSLPDVGAWFIGAAAGLAALVLWRSAARYNKATRPWTCPLHGRRNNPATTKQYV